MTLDRHFFISPTGQIVLVSAVLLVGVLTVRWHQQQTQTAPLPSAKPAPTVMLPRVLTRDGARFPQPSVPTAAAGSALATTATAQPTPLASENPRVLPLTLFSMPLEPTPPAVSPHAPYGRLIPCETVVALESNRIETPVIGLVTENVWHDGRLVIPAGAEVHGRAALDRSRERLAAQGIWRIVWRTPDAENGTELSIDGLALDREFDGASGTWGKHDGSAGLRGQIVKTNDERELKLFAATFLATATTALQDTRATAGLLGETTLPRPQCATRPSPALARYYASMRKPCERPLRATASTSGSPPENPSTSTSLKPSTEARRAAVHRSRSPLLPAYEIPNRSQSAFRRLSVRRTDCAASAAVEIRSGATSRRCGANASRKLSARFRSGRVREKDPPASAAHRGIDQPKRCAQRKARRTSRRAE